jgi:hypothetical protein
MKPCKSPFTASELSQLVALKYLQAAMMPAGPERDRLLKVADLYRADADAQRWIEESRLSPTDGYSFH